MIEWGSVADWAVAVTAVFGVAAGLVQLKSARERRFQVTPARSQVDWKA